jgi:Zn-dependent alcohol dehydrogenase
VPVPAADVNNAKYSKVKGGWQVLFAFHGNTSFLRFAMRQVISTNHATGTIVIFGLANPKAAHRFGVRFSFVLLAVGAPVPVGRFYSGAIVGRKTKPN